MERFMSAVETRRGRRRQFGTGLAVAGLVEGPPVPEPVHVGVMAKTTHRCGAVLAPENSAGSLVAGGRRSVTRDVGCSFQVKGGGVRRIIVEHADVRAVLLAGNLRSLGGRRGFAAGRGRPL